MFYFVVGRRESGGVVACEYSMYVLVINLRVRDIGNLCIGVGTRFDSPVETLGHSLKFYVLVE